MLLPQMMPPSGCPSSGAALPWTWVFARFKSGPDQTQFSKSPFHKDDRILRFILGRFLGVGLETSIPFQKPQGNDGPREAPGKPGSGGPATSTKENMAVILSIAWL